MSTRTRVGDTAADVNRSGSVHRRAHVKPVPGPVGPPLRGDGRSPQAPIVIDATTSIAGVPAEYDWLKKRYGVLERDWTIDVRSLGRNEQGRTIETFPLQLKGGDRVDVHFDITGFHQL